MMILLCVASSSGVGEALLRRLPRRPADVESEDAALRMMIRRNCEGKLEKKRRIVSERLRLLQNPPEWTLTGEWQRCG